MYDVFCCSHMFQPQVRKMSYDNFYPAQKKVMLHKLKPDLLVIDCRWRFAMIANIVDSDFSSTIVSSCNYGKEHAYNL